MTARNLQHEPLIDVELRKLAEGYPPSTLGGLDHEEVVIHLATRLLEANQEICDLEYEMMDVSEQLSLTEDELRDKVGP